MRSLLLLFVILISVFGLTPHISAQTQKEHEKSSYVDSLNRYYQHVDLPVYLYISTSPTNSNSKPLKEINGNNNTIEPIYLDGPGIHHLRHMDAIHNKIDVFHIYGDAKAPVTKLKTSVTPSYKTKEGVLYFGKGFNIDLNSKDDMSGVKQVYISVNGSEYIEYSGTKYFNESGDYIIQYYAVDNVGNIEKPNKYIFTIDHTPPKTFHNVVGIASGKVISMATRIYLDKEDNGAGVKSTYYHFDNEPQKLLTGREIPFKQLDNGEHTLYYWSEDRVNNEEEKQSFSFYLDKVAPIASMDMLGDKFVVNDKIYFSGRTKVKLTAVDNRTGVKELKYSLNNSIYQDYVEPFYMPNKAGLYTIKYYAVDDTDNRSDGEDMHSRGVIYVDLSGPALNYKLEGPIFKKGNDLYVGAKTRFSISGKDMESGLQYLAYTINNGDEIRYENPFSIGDVGGEYAITYIGYDNVNNRNQYKLKLMLDAIGPTIDVKYSSEPESEAKNKEKIYPSYVRLFISATDAQTTVASIVYSINDGKEVAYNSPIKGFEPNKRYVMKIKAKDVLENESTSEINFQTGSY